MKGICLTAHEVHSTEDIDMFSTDSAAIGCPKSGFPSNPATLKSLNMTKPKSP